MEGAEFPARFSSKSDQVISNLKNWKFLEWVIFWGFVPVLLLLIYTLPQSIKSDYFILNTAFPWRIQTWFLSSYTHSQLYPHLIGNFIFYFIELAMIFAFEDNKRRFWLLIAWSFCIVPFVSSFLTIIFWGVLGINTSGQGFSAINGALLAYAFFTFSSWGMKEFLEIIDCPELFQGPKIRFQVAKAGMILIVVLIMVMGFFSGQFLVADGSTVNGLVHFGGFFSSLLILLIFDLRDEKRKNFDQILSASILVGVLGYVYYLFHIVRLVRGP